MAGIIQKVGMIYARPQGTVYEDQKIEGRNAFEKGEAEEAEWRDLIFYAAYDFDTCYEHHVEGEPYEVPDKRYLDEYTVLRKPDRISRFAKQEFKDIFCAALRNGRITKKGEFDFIFPEKEAVALKFKDGTAKDRSKAFRAKIHCMDIRSVTITTLPGIAKGAAMSEKEIQKAQQYIANSYTPNSGYRIRLIWIIGHTDIRIA